MFQFSEPKELFASFTLDGFPTSSNRRMAQGGGRWVANPEYLAQKNEWGFYIKNACLANKVISTKEKVLVLIQIFQHKRRRTDCDNQAKILLDVMEGERRVYHNDRQVDGYAIWRTIIPNDETEHVQLDVYFL